MAYWLSDSENAEIKASRSDWSTYTWQDSVGVWHATVQSNIGWGNAGVYDLGNHIHAIRGRARRALAKRGQSGHMIVTHNRIDSMNVLGALTFGIENK